MLPMTMKSLSEGVLPTAGLISCRSSNRYWRAAESRNRNRSLATTSSRISCPLLIHCLSVHGDRGCGLRLRCLYGLRASRRAGGMISQNAIVDRPQRGAILVRLSAVTSQPVIPPANDDASRIPVPPLPMSLTSSQRSRHGSGIGQLTVLAEFWNGWGGRPESLGLAP
jgi:hypothetical protein